jgi:hypothetical protein
MFNNVTGLVLCSTARFVTGTRHLTAFRLMRRMRAPSRTVSAVLNCSTAASSVASRSGFPAAAKDHNNNDCYGGVEASASSKFELHAVGFELCSS